MKKLLLLGFLSLSFNVGAKTYRLKQLDKMQEQIDALTSRVEKLEGKVSDIDSKPSTDPSSGLKVIDKKNEELGSNSQPTSRTISSEQQAEIMNQLKAYKKNREEQQKILDQIMEE